MDTKTARQEAPAPAFDELMLAMDAVDTIRFEASVLETELSGDGRREALKARLREYYAGQGIEVTDDILDTAVAGMHRDRFVNEPLGPGLARTLAITWIRRGRYARRAAVLAGATAIAISAGTFAHDRLVVAPRERAAAELQADLSTRLPVALAKAHADAVAAARDYGDDTAEAVADNRREAAERLIEARDRDGAFKAIVELEQLGSAIRMKVAAAALMEQAATADEDARSRVTEPAAATAMEPLLRNLADVAASGDGRAYSAAGKRLDDFIFRVETPFEIRIVDREGILSGVWRTNDNGRTRVHYLVVEAVDPSGRPVPMDIRSFETGVTKTVTHWGVRVPESEYNRVGADKTSDGVIDRRTAGRKPAGSLGIVWDIPAGEQMITEW